MFDTALRTNLIDISKKHTHQSAHIEPLRVNTCDTWPWSHSRFERTTCQAVQRIAPLSSVPGMEDQRSHFQSSSMNECSGRNSTLNADDVEPETLVRNLHVPVSCALKFGLLCSLPLAFRATELIKFVKFIQ